MIGSVQLHAVLGGHCIDTPATAVKIFTAQIFMLDPLPRWKFAHDPQPSSINYAHWALEEPLTISKVSSIPSLTAWPASNFCFDRLTSCTLTLVMGGRTVTYLVSPLDIIFAQIEASSE